MGKNGVSEVSAGTVERVGRMVNGTSNGVYCRAESLRGGSLGGGLVSTMNWQRLWGFLKVTEGVW